MKHENAENRFEVEENVNYYINLLEKRKYNRRLLISEVCNDLSIFDWWNDFLSISQLKAMKSFLNTAGKLGYNGYVCFKVGAAGCSHGMWANKEKSVNGHSPDGECLFHSFRSGDNYWDCKLPDGEWMFDRYPDRDEFTLKEIKKELGY